jgi:PmbA protein
VRLLEALRAGAGVDRWSLYVTHSRRATLGVKDREAGNSHAPLSLSESCGARYLFVWDDGTLSRGFLERRQLEGDPAETLASTRAAAYDDEDAAQVLGPAEFPDVLLHDELAAATAHGKTDWIAARLNAVRERLADSGVRTWSGSFNAGETGARLITSAGLDVEGQGTSIGWYVTVDGEIGDGFRRRESDTDDEFHARVEQVMELARALKEPAEPMGKGVVPVILHPGVVEEYCLPTLLHHLDGATIAHEEGLFRPEQFGSDQPVLREDLSLRLNPLESLRSGSYRFSTEGIPAAPCTYIERGCLVEPILDLKYARRLDRKPTPMPYSMDVLHLEGKERLTVEQARQAADGGARVLAVLGVHTQDSSSGDFSLSAPQVLRVSSGGFRGRLRATISGNLFEALRSESLQLVEFDGENTPGMLFPCHLDPK